MIDAVPLQTWQTAVLDRLEVLYPLDPEESLGEVVPREAFDPQREFDPRQTPRLVQDLLTRLSRGDNPFLLSRRDLVARGFVGMPYLFDVEADRDRRFSW